MERQYRLNKIGSQDMGWVLLLIFASPHSFLYMILLANVDRFYSNILFIFYCQKNTCQNRYYIVKVDWLSQITFSIVNVIRLISLIVLRRSHFGYFDFSKSLALSTICLLNLV